MLDAGSKIGPQKIENVEDGAIEVMMRLLASRWAPLIALVIAAAGSASPQSRTLSLRLSLNDTAGPLEIDRFALGQGGLSEEPMWADRAAEIRDLHPRLIRLFIQEYFDLLPERGRYHFQKLDESVDLILKRARSRS